METGTSPDIPINVWNSYADYIMEKSSDAFVCKGSVEDLVRERGDDKDFVDNLTRFMVVNQHYAAGMIFSKDHYNSDVKEYWIEVWSKEKVDREDSTDEMYRKFFSRSDPRVRDCYDASNAFAIHLLDLFESDELEKASNNSGYEAKVYPEPHFRHEQV